MNDDTEPDILRPATYLTPGELAEVDQWEMDVKIHAEECIEMMREIEAESGPQSLAVWSYMLRENVDPDRLASVLAYFFLKESRRTSEETS